MMLESCHLVLLKLWLSRETKKQEILSPWFKMNYHMNILLKDSLDTRQWTQIRFDHVTINTFLYVSMSPSNNILNNWDVHPSTIHFSWYKLYKVHDNIPIGVDYITISDLSHCLVISSSALWLAVSFNSNLSLHPRN